jgi:hypothetical protein
MLGIWDWAEELIATLMVTHTATLTPHSLRTLPCTLSCTPGTPL